MYHTLQWFSNVGTGLINSPLAGAQDQIFPLNTSGNFLVPKPVKMLAGFGVGTSLGRIRVNTPTLRTVSLPSAVPINAAAAVPSLPGIVNYYGLGPNLPVNDELEIDATNSDGAAAHDMYYTMFVGDDNRSFMPGPVYTVRATASITAGAKVWGNGQFAFDQTLAPGQYSVIGLDVIGANLIAARLVFVDGGFRPGCVARTSTANLPWPMFRQGLMGELGRFYNTAPPSIDLFGTAAPTTQEIYLDLVKVG